MYDQIREDIFYIMLYAGVVVLAMLASCYLLFRDGNAFAADINTPVRLRRWTGAFFASVALNHLWFMPILLTTTSKVVMMVELVGMLLDFLTVFPLAIVVLLTMLQDRRRPLWPAFVIMTPLVVVMILSVVIQSYALMEVLAAYFLLMSIGLIIYMVREVRHYGRWLRDNYADLEHKEVWQSFVALAIMLLVFGIYVLTGEGPVYQYAMQVVVAVLICFLLWRVEMLSDLSGIQPQGLPVAETALVHDRSALPAVLSKDFGPMLQQHCIDAQIYLQHDLTVTELAKVIGTNRFYLSQYFSSLGLTYNEYINELRIRHFINLYGEAVADHHPVTAQQLANQSGFHSYSTFSRAFKQRMGQSVTAWMRDPAK